MTLVILVAEMMGEVGGIVRDIFGHLWSLVPRCLSSPKSEKNRSLSNRVQKVIIMSIRENINPNQECHILPQLLFLCYTYVTKPLLITYARFPSPMPQGSLMPLMPRGVQRGALMSTRAIDAGA